MDRNELEIAVKNDFIEWQRHALERMMERGISKETVTGVLLAGEVIENYPDDKPYPSALFLGWSNNEPFHVVAAMDSSTGYCMVVTAYRPGLDNFEPDYRTRRKHGN